MDILSLIGRKNKLFSQDISKHEKELREIVSSSTFLVIGGAGSIGQAVVKEIFKRNPRKLHVVDISENNMVELVRDVRSSLGYIEGDFRLLLWTLDLTFTMHLSTQMENMITYSIYLHSNMCAVKKTRLL